MSHRFNPPPVTRNARSNRRRAMNCLYRAALEPLEQRQYLSGLYWNAGTGDWNSCSETHTLTTNDFAEV